MSIYDRIVSLIGCEWWYRRDIAEHLGELHLAHHAIDALIEQGVLVEDSTRTRVRLADSPSGPHAPVGSPEPPPPTPEDGSAVVPGEGQEDRHHGLILDEVPSPPDASDGQLREATVVGDVRPPSFDGPGSPGLPSDAGGAHAGPEPAAAGAARTAAGGALASGVGGLLRGESPDAGAFSRLAARAEPHMPAHGVLLTPDQHRCAFCGAVDSTVAWDVTEDDYLHPTHPVTGRCLRPGDDVTVAQALTPLPDPVASERSESVTEWALDSLRLPLRVQHLLLRRREQGTERYPTELLSHTGRPARVDALQEAVDLLLYLAQDAMERPGTSRLRLDLVCNLVADLAAELGVR